MSSTGNTLSLNPDKLASLEKIAIKACDSELMKGMFESIYTRIQLLKFLKANPDNEHLHQLMAHICFARGKRVLCDRHFDKAISLGIDDGGFSLLTKAMNNMYSRFMDYNAVTCLRQLYENRLKYQAEMKGPVEEGIYDETNKFGFTSKRIDLRSPATLATVIFMYATASFDFDEKDEAIALLEEAIELDPTNQEYTEKLAQFRRQGRD